MGSSHRPGPIGPGGFPRTAVALCLGLGIATLLSIAPVPARASGPTSLYLGHHRYLGGYGYHWGYGHPRRVYYRGWVGWPGARGYAGWPYYVVPERIDPRAPGAVETDVQPKKAAVHVDGAFLGQARDYNGRWNLLWLEPGEHVIEFSKGGYLTLRRHIDLRPGMQVRVVEQLQKGEGVDPRSSTGFGSEVEMPTGAGPAPAPPPPREPPPQSGDIERGLLRIDVEPLDAAIYLDGEFLARASELSRLHGALPVAQGSHRIEVVRPGYESRSVDIEIGANEPVRVEIILEPRN